ncbi:MAG: HigA family addiction module antitoxin [Rickettsiales bacterium]
MPRTPIHPGKFLADELETLNMNAAQLAGILHIPPNRVYQILQGKRSLTADTALRLAQWLGTSAQFWLNLQTLYELRCAEQEIGREIKRTIRPWQISNMPKATRPHQAESSLSDTSH